MNEPNKDVSIEDRVTALEVELNTLKKIISADVVNITTPSVKKLSVKEFLLAKNTDNDVKRTIAVAYFLEKFEGVESFNIDDLKKYYQLAKQQLPANPNDKVNMAIKGGFLMEAEEKKDSKKAWTLTASGEKVVEDNFVISKN